MLKRKFHLILMLYHTYTVLLHLSSASTLGATVQFGRKQCSKKITEYSTQYILSSTLTTTETLCEKFWEWTKLFTCKEKKRIYRMRQVLKSKSKTIPTCCKNWNEMNETICVKVNRAWSAWTSFSVCPVTCGEGIQYRHRSCDDPFPQYNDDYCVGNATESKACNTVNCPVDGGWSIWTDWGSCNVTCGGGTQSRSRFCSNPYPQYGGVNCPGEPADTEICNNHTCSVDGGWSIWTDWGSCNVTCGGGTQSRSRFCSNPYPQYGGVNCPGEPADTEICNNHTCSVDGGWSIWTDWGSCNVTCGGGTQSRSRFCSNPYPQYGGVNCPGEPADTEICNNHTCSVDGGWSIWTDWGSCNVTCGGGTQSRSRFCSNPYPQYGGVNCPGESADTEICNNHTCSGETMKTGNQPNMIQTKNIPIIVPVSVVPPVIVTVIVIGVVCIRMQKRKRSRRGDQGGNDREMNITSSNVFGKPRKNKAPHRYEVSSRNKDKGKKEVSATYDEIVDKNRFMDEYEVPSSCNIQDKYEKHGKIQKPGKFREQNEDLDTEEEQDIYEVLDQYETLDQYESLDQYETLDKQESLNIN